MSTCEECGVTGRGAFIADTDGRELCTDCAAPGECERCGRETNQRTLTGDWLCAHCGDRESRSVTRDSSQHALADFERGDHADH